MSRKLLNRQMIDGLKGLGKAIYAHRGLVIPGLLAVILSDALQLVVPLVAGRMVDRLTPVGGLVAATRRDLVESGLLLLALAIGTGLARTAWRRYLFAAARRAEADLRQRILERAISLPAGHFARSSTGEVMALATNDVLAVRMALAMGLVAAFDATVFTIVAVVAMASLDWRLTLWTILPFPVLAVVMLVSLRLIYERFDRVQAVFERLTEKVRESLAGMRVLRAYAQESGDEADFEGCNSEYYDRYLDYVKVDSLFRPAILGLAGLSTAILLGVGGSRVVRGETSLGDFTALSVYLGMLIWPMIAAGWMVTLIQRGAASMSRIQQMLALDPEDSRVQDPVGELPPIQGRLEVRGLGFRYPGAAASALRDLEFEVPRGGSLGVVGEVGSGKSTLAALLCRLYNPPPGTILLDGADVNERDLEDLRRAVSLVPQESFLFSDTIAENLRLGAPDAPLEALREACDLAAVDGEILEFPQGYETVLGERGITLSGGQKQRLCLARALLKQAPVLVLDDTLSAVDAESEHRILERLAAERQDAGSQQARTLIVISHRISAVRDLDRILVLCRGQVVQAGRHEDLVAVPGYYRDLYELQQLEA